MGLGPRKNSMGEPLSAVASVYCEEEIGAGLQKNPAKFCA
jgi:hypothetical protein